MLQVEILSFYVPGACLFGIDPSKEGSLVLLSLCTLHFPTCILTGISGLGLLPVQLLIHVHSHLGSQVKSAELVKTQAIRTQLIVSAVFDVSGLLSLF